MKMKHIIFSFIFLFAVTGAAQGVYGEGKDISILLNNQPVVSDKAPVNRNGTVFVPLRSVAEAMGCEVIWVNGEKTANIKNETTIISMKVGNNKISKVKRNSDGTTMVIPCDDPPVILDGSVYIPLRAMAESFGATVGWDGESRTVMIMYDTTVKSSNKTLVSYAGHGGRKRYDSTVDKMEFLSPESMDIAADGSIVISDSGAVRKIINGKSETVEFEPDYISSAVVRCYGNDIYFTTNAFEDENGEKYYGIVKLTGGQAEGIYITEAVYSKITDFDIDSKGNIYALVYNAGVGKNYIARLNKDDMEFLKDVDEGFTCMTIDKNDCIFMGNSVKGSIYYFDPATKEIRGFAGVDNNTRFVDGNEPMLFEPRSLFYKDNTLYVLDYNLIRSIDINNGNIASNAQTLAGKISTELKPQTKPGKASDAELAPNYLSEIAVKDGTVYFTDPVNGILWAVE